MSPYDATKYTRRMFHNLNIVPFCGALLILIVMVGFSHNEGRCSSCCPIDLPFVYSGHNAEGAGDMLTIEICGNGRVCFDDRHISDLSTFPRLIKDKLEWFQPEERDKVRLEIEGDVVFERVQEVLLALKRSGIEEGVLISRPYAPADYLFEPVDYL